MYKINSNPKKLQHFCNAVQSPSVTIFYSPNFIILIVLLLVLFSFCYSYSQTTLSCVLEVFSLLENSPSQLGQ